MSHVTPLGWAVQQPSIFRTDLSITEFCRRFFLDNAADLSGEQWLTDMSRVLGTGVTDAHACNRRTRVCPLRALLAPHPSASHSSHPRTVEQWLMADLSGEPWLTDEFNLIL